MRALIRAFVMATVVTVMLCAILSLSRHRHVLAAAPAALDTSAVFDDQQKNDDEMVKGSVDLYGNDVTDAVAKYSLDATGSLYEVHSPQTELPRLGSPKS